MTSLDFRDMASEREAEASELDDSEIWMTVISKFVKMEFPMENKIEMMLQATGEDKNLVIKAVKACLENQLINETQATETLNALES